MYLRWWFLIWLIDVIDVLTLVASDMTDWCDWYIDCGGLWYDRLMWLMYGPLWFLIGLVDIYIFINVHFPTQCPKGTQQPYNLHSSPKCWPVISNINIYFNCHRLPTLLAAYIKYKCSLSNPVPEGHTETLLLTFIPQMLAWYIQYQHLFQLSHTPNTVGIIFPIQMFTLQHCTRWAHRNPLTYIHPPNVGMVYPISTYILNWYMLPKLLAAYIKYNYVFL